MMERFCKSINGAYPFAIYAKSSIIDVRLDSKYTFDKDKKYAVNSYFKLTQIFLSNKDISLPKEESNLI